MYGLYIYIYIMVIWFVCSHVSSNVHKQQHLLRGIRVRFSEIPTYSEYKNTCITASQWQMLIYDDTKLRAGTTASLQCADMCSCIMMFTCCHGLRIFTCMHKVKVIHEKDPHVFSVCKLQFQVTIPKTVTMSWC